jgi:hypothetical protein
MALTLRLNGSLAQNLVTASWWNDYYDLLTGVMLDQPITLRPVVTHKMIANSAGAPTAALQGGTALGIGSYMYGITFITADGGETLPNVTPASITTTSGNQAVSLTNIPVGPGGTVKRGIYRTKVGTSSPYYLVAILNDNSTTSYSDTTPDASLTTLAPVYYTFGGATVWEDSAGIVMWKAGGGVLVGSNVLAPFGAAPASAPSLTLAAGTNLGVGTYQYVVTFQSGLPPFSTGESLPSPVASITTTSGNQQVNLTNIPIGPAGTRKRTLYRTTAGGSTFMFLANIGDNTSTTFTDSIADGSLGSQTPPSHPTFGGALVIMDAMGTTQFTLSSDGYILNPIRWGMSLKGSNQVVLGIKPPDGNKNYQLLYDANDHLAFWNNTDSRSLLDIDSSGNITVGGSIKLPGGGSLSIVSTSIQYQSQQSGAAGGHYFQTWNGSSSVTPFSIGGQLGSALSWVDNTGTFFGKLKTVRNGTAQGNTIFTGTSTPSSPSTGDIWIKA